MNITAAEEAYWWTGIMPGWKLQTAVLELQDPAGDANGGWTIRYHDTSKHLPADTGSVWLRSVDCAND